MPLASMDGARAFALSAGRRATLAMGMLMLFTLLRADTADVFTQGAEITVVCGAPSQYANGGFTDGRAIQAEQGAGLQGSVA
ncbi:hypothetical protein [Roseateles sp. YR242]|uniref:hypothetical protein n=1 Tax=Roseateles sp. YR242 TaxID=1855305 RepID=UPI000B885A34|nr:hypothetical protein [Roseateles sp. YR242]